MLSVRATKGTSGPRKLFTVSQPGPLPINRFQFKIVLAIKQEGHSSPPSQFLMWLNYKDYRPE